MPPDAQSRALLDGLNASGHLPFRQNDPIALRKQALALRVMKPADSTDDLCRKIARQTSAVVFNIDYHLSPEAKFPVAVNDAYASLCWVAQNAERFGVDPERIALAEDSAGSNLVNVTCLMARQLPRPRRAALRRGTVNAAALSPLRADRRNFKPRKVESRNDASSAPGAIAATRPRLKKPHPPAITSLSVNRKG